MHNFSATPKSQNSKHRPLLLILALAFALNLHGLAADSFWGDEIFTASFAARPIPEVIRWTAEDIHPPLYYLIARSFTQLTIPLGFTSDPTAVSDWLWRFPSVLAVVLTVAVTYRIAYCVVRSAYHRPYTTHHALRTTAPSSLLAITPPAAALLLTLAPIAIKYGQEARMHALFMFFSALTTWLLLRAVAKPQRWQGWLLYALATTANIYTMYFGFLVLAAQAGLVAFWIYDLRFTKSQITTHHAPRTTHYAILSGFGLATLLACLLYLPWWPVLLNLLRRRAAVGAIEGGVGDPVTFVTGVVDALGPQPTPVAWLFLALFGLGLIFLARSARPLAVFGLLWLALPVALPIFLGDPRALQFRYAFILPIYLTIIATAIGGLSHQIEQLISTQSGQSPISNLHAKRPISTYLLWILATLSFIATLGIYAQTKPNWRAAAAYLTERTKAADLIVVAPLWDEGRFLEYYYRGAAPLLTPAALVTNIQGRAEGLRLGGGQIWGVSRFAPAESPATKNIDFTGVVIAEPQMPVYEPQLLAGAALDLAAQAVEAAYPWAVEAEAQGVLTPDPRTAQAVALRAWADALVAAGKPEEAVAAYQRAVDIFPGWVNGYLALAEAQEGLGNLPAAAKAYQQAVTFNLDWHGPPADEASRLVKAQAWADAIEQYHQITEN